MKESTFFFNRDIKFKAFNITYWVYFVLSFAADDDPEEVMKKWESMPNWQQEKIVKQIFEEDTRCIRKSDAVILLLPAGISAHVEIGFAHGLNKKCVLIGKPEKTESAYMIFDETYASIEDFIKSIK